MEETFEDFDSDDQEFDAFSDDEIANVLELMGGDRSYVKEESVKQQSSVRQERLVEQPAATPMNPFDAFLQSAMEEPNAEVQVVHDAIPLERQSEVAQTESSETTTIVTDLEHYFEGVYGSELSRCSSPRSLEKDDCGNTNLCSDVTGFKSYSSAIFKEESSKTCVSAKSDFESLMDRASHESMDRRQDKAADMDNASLSAYQLIEKLETSMQKADLDVGNIITTINATLLIPADEREYNGNQTFMQYIHTAERALQHNLIRHIAVTSEERWELILTALSVHVKEVPPTITMKWDKTLSAMTLFSSMSANENNLIPSRTHTEKRQVELIIGHQIDDVEIASSFPQDPIDAQTDIYLSTDPESPSPSSLNVQRSCDSCPSMEWGKFSPAKMPALHSLEMLTIPQKEKTCTINLGRKCARSSHHCSRLRGWRDDAQKFTFCPRINSRSKRLRNQSQPLFTQRMEKDIHLRRVRQEKIEKEKDERESMYPTGKRHQQTLVAPGSQHILKRNGLWDETIDHRIQRLNRKPSKRKQSANRREQKLRQKQAASAVAARTCESLYRRGLEKRRRDEKRIEDDKSKIKRSSAQSKMTHRSQIMINDKIRQEIAFVCTGRPRSTTGKLDAKISSKKKPKGNKWLTFVEFSCALVYFGLVPDVNIPWKGNDKITLLWFAWTAFVDEQEGHREFINAKHLEHLLLAVILQTPFKSKALQDRKDMRELVHVLRVNYVSRRSNNFPPSSNMKHNKPTGDQEISSLKTTTVKQTSSSQEYTLHGKPRKSTCTVDHLSERQKATQARVQRLRALKEQMDVAECTFRPKINDSLVGSHSGTHIWTTYDGAQPPKESRIHAFDRLYGDAMHRHNKSLENYFHAKLEAEELEKKECAISPGYVNGLSIDERLHKLQNALANNQLPVHFHEKTEAMRSAYTKKAHKEQECAKRFLPAHFEKAQDGRTIVVPFQLATDHRARLKGGQQIETPSSSSSASHRRKTNSIMKGLRPANSSDAITRYPTPISDTDICVDVHVSPLETHRLFLTPSDDPQAVVDAFAKQHGLGLVEHGRLLRFVRSKLIEPVERDRTTMHSMEIPKRAHQPRAQSLWA